jgi:hypothetical protein
MSGEPGELFIGIAAAVALWLAPPLLGAWTFRRKGYSPHWTWFGILPLVGLVVLCVALILPSWMPRAHAPVITSHTRPAPQLPSSAVVLFPALVCAWLGGVSSGDRTFSIAPPPPSAIIGGSIGLLLGWAVYLDNRAVQRRIEETASGAALEPRTGSTPASAKGWRSNTIALIMLVLPLVAGLLIWQREMMQMTTRAVRLLDSATILSTAILGYYDMRRLVLRSRGTLPASSQSVSPQVAAFLGILGLWLLAYPVHFLARRRLGATNLIVPALVVTAVSLTPTVSAWFSGPGLPSVDSPDVLALVAKIIEDSPMNQARKDQIEKLEVREPVEISFDQGRQRRVARATLVSKLGEEEIFYTVEWQDRKKGTFSVQMYDKQP